MKHLIIGHNTWIFEHKPVIISTGVVGGPFEAEGKISNDFDRLHDNIELNQESFEKAQQAFFEDACDITLKKAQIEKEQVSYFIGGDLINQITPTTFTAKLLGVPYFGIFSACATSMEGLALAALIINCKGANYVLTGTASHNAATERQYRYPNEYGGQKPPTSQWTVTGAGCALVAQAGNGPVITSATIGKVVDYGMSDPFNMGGAMAPAAADTIIRHLYDLNVDIHYYDYIITGDLGEVGLSAAYELLSKKGIDVPEGKLIDCGLTIYSKDQAVHAGASGSASSAVATYGHFIKRMNKGEINRMLIVATGSLHSPLSIQQNNTIPCIAHAVAIESGGMLQ